MQGIAMENITSILALLNIDPDSLPDNFTLDDFLKVVVEYKDTGHWFSSSTELFLVLSFCLVMVCGLTGNLVVCLLICRRGNLKSSRNLYILNLSLSEIMTCILCMPFILVRMTLKNWRLGLILCKIVPTLQTTYVFVSTLTVVAIAADRYRVIVCSVTRNHHKQRTKFIIPMIWVLSLGMSIPLFFSHEIEDVYGVSGYVLYSICIESWSSFPLLAAYTICVLVVQYLSPVLAIVTLHVLICRFLGMRIHTRQVSLREVNRAKRNMASHKKNMYLLTSIAVSFAVAWLPITLTNMLADFEQAVFENRDFRLIHSVCLLVALCSVCINPVVYGWFNSNFRRDLHRWASTKNSIRGSFEIVQYVDASTHKSNGEIVSTCLTHRVSMDMGR